MVNQLTGSKFLNSNIPFNRMDEALQYCIEHPVLTVGLTAAALGTTAMMFGGPEPVKPPLSLSQQSVELPVSWAVTLNPAERNVCFCFGCIEHGVWQFIEE